MRVVEAPSVGEIWHFWQLLLEFILPKLQRGRFQGRSFLCGSGGADVFFFQVQVCMIIQSLKVQKMIIIRSRKNSTIFER